MPDIAIARMFKDFGIATPGAQKTAREALARAGIISSRPNRTAIASEKVDRARHALETAFVWHCGNGDCRTEAEASGACSWTRPTARSAAVPRTAVH